MPIGLLCCVRRYKLLHMRRHRPRYPGVIEGNQHGVGLKGDVKMTKILTVLIAGLFAASVFAADAAPKADDVKAAAATGSAPAPAAAKKPMHKHHQKQAKKAAEAATPAK